MNLLELREKLRPNIKKYLAEQGISPENIITCLNPAHEDQNPSMSFNQRDNVYHCFSCGATADIFQAFHYLENAPINGQPFIYDNLFKLCERYNIEIPTELVDKKQTLKILLSRAYQTACQLLISDTFWNQKHIQDRGWDPVACKTYFIGSIKNQEAFFQTLSRNLELSIQELKDLGISDKLFSEECITYTILDKNHNPIGFQSRNINYKERGIPKCYTTPNLIYQNGVKLNHPFLSFGTRIFGLQVASKKVYNRLDIFEGPGSWIQAIQNGHNSCISILGNGLNKEIVGSLYALGFRNLNLVFDSDEVGQKRMKSCIENINPPLGCKISITQLDEENLDPEDYIKKHGISKYKSLQPIGLFELRVQNISKENEELDIEQLCEIIIPLIVNSDNKISQTNMIHKLAKECLKLDPSLELSNLEDSIRSEVERKSTEQSDTIKGYVQKGLQRATSKYEVREVLDDALRHIDEDFKKTTKNRLDNADSALKFSELMSEIEATDSTPGWITGINNIDNLMTMIPKKESNMIVFGDPHHGKSAILQYIMKSMSKLYDRNKDLSILYWPLDDAYELSVLRILESEAGVDKKVLMNLQPTKNDLQKNRIKEAKDTIFQLMTDQRLLIKDLSKINNLYMAERWVRNTQNSTGNNVILVIDALNDIPVPGTSSDYEKQARVVEWLQTTSADLGCNIFCTAHTNKRKAEGGGSGEPHSSNLKGNNHLEFAGKIIASVYNELHDRGPVRAKHAWIKNDRVMPAIKMNFMKVKTFLGNKGVSWFKMDETTISISETTESKVLYEAGKTTEQKETPNRGEPDILSLNESVFVKEETKEPLDLL